MPGGDNAHESEGTVSPPASAEAAAAEGGPDEEPDAAGYVRFDDVRLTKSPALPRHLYTGRERDAESGLWQYRFRYYDPGTGTFLGEDPAYLDADNTYRYVFNSPTNLTDPWGLGAQGTRGGIPATYGVTMLPSPFTTGRWPAVSASPTTSQSVSEIRPSVDVFGLYGDNDTYSTLLTLSPTPTATLNGAPAIVSLRDEPLYLPRWVEEGYRVILPGPIGDPPSRLDVMMDSMLAETRAGAETWWRGMRGGARFMARDPVGTWDAMIDQNAQAMAQRVVIAHQMGRSWEDAQREAVSFSSLVKDTSGAGKFFEGYDARDYFGDVTNQDRVVRMLQGGGIFALTTAALAAPFIPAAEAAPAAVTTSAAGAGSSSLIVPGSAAGRMGLRVLQQICFAAGTQVIVGINPDGSYFTRSIEDLRPGDLVLARNQCDAADSIDARPVSRVFNNVSDHLRVVTIRDTDGNVESIRTTDEHPYWVNGIGWLRAADLETGMRLNEGDDSNDATVVSSVRETHPEGVAVYNFEVRGDHTYFVEDGKGDQTAVWVHNSCSPLRSALIAAGQRAKKYAAHIVPRGNFSGRAFDVQQAIRRTKTILERAGVGIDSKLNGLFTNSARNLGTHTDDFFLKMGEVTRTTLQRHMTS